MYNNALLNKNFNQIDDRELIQSILNGEQKAFSHMIRKYKDAVFGCAYSAIGNFHEAEDIAQETFIYAYFNLEKLKDASKLGGWLCSISKYKSYNYIKRHKAKVSTVDIETMDTISDSFNNPLETTLNKELRSNILTAINSLSDSLRDTVILYYISGYSQIEVARLLNVPLGTVKWRLHDSKKRIKEELLPMVRETLEENKPSEDFVEKVQKMLEEAANARVRKEYKEMSDKCDVALELINNITDTVKERELKEKALDLKGESITFPLGVKDALKYYEEVLKLKKEKGDKLDYAKYLIRIGLAYGNANKRDMAISAYEEALDILTKLNNKSGQAECLLWIGRKHFNYDVKKASTYFERALYLFKETGYKSYEAVCDAAIKEIKKVGSIISTKRLVSYDAVCEILEKNSDGITRVGQPGFSGRQNRTEEDKKFSISLFHSIGQMKTMLDTTKKIGDTWSKHCFSLTFNPLEATATIESNTEVISTPAGEFHDCLKVKMIINRSKLDDENNKRAKKNLRNCGTKEVWYAPGVGVVKFKFQRADGVNIDIQLASYEVKSSENEYLPLAIGNKWSYTIADMDDRYEYEDVLEVLSQEESKYYISHYQYAYFKGSEEEYRKICSKE